MLAIACDVSSPDQVEAAIRQVVIASDAWTSPSIMPVWRTRQPPSTKLS